MGYAYDVSFYFRELADIQRGYTTKSSAFCEGALNNDADMVQDLYILQGFEHCLDWWKAEECPKITPAIIHDLFLEWLDQVFPYFNIL